MTLSNRSLKYFASLCASLCNVHERRASRPTARDFARGTGVGAVVSSARSRRLARDGTVDIDVDVVSITMGR